MKPKPGSAAIAITSKSDPSRSSSSTTTFGPCCSICRWSVSRNAASGPAAPGIQSSGTLEQLLLHGCEGAHVLTAELGDDPPARRPLDETELEQVGLVDVLDRVGLLAERD